MMLDRLLQVFRPKKDRRRHPRIYDPPLKLSIGKQEYLTDDWSITGCRISSYLGDAALGSRIEGYQVDTPGRLKFFTAELVWRDPDNSAGFRFLQIENMYASTSSSWARYIFATIDKNIVHQPFTCPRCPRISLAWGIACWKGWKYSRCKRGIYVRLACIRRLHGNCCSGLVCLWQRSSWEVNLVRTLSAEQSPQGHPSYEFSHVSAGGYGCHHQDSCRRLRCATDIIGPVSDFLPICPGHRSA